ncbi:LacI family DNA-binding transcriptional regulator [Streptomyces sp. GMR22]|uniref:LacI family DNA-binding transcriptional regulator n=1 Tax=Streptomyces sp. GMR22 TaxID=2759524 RepID=UPI0015FA6E96|nr:LacI family DNA-binding transcriptional regulator [Streptomyces sp. GMR22]MBA6436486.1 LacI family DNA-binding transcriptional regulator [Streptomyces sp. GMR22]
MVRLADVARAAGVSTSTASRALSRPDMVAAETRERVSLVAAEMGFRLNATARALTTGHTGLVGVIVPTLANPFFPPIVTGVQQPLTEAGGNVLLGVSDHSADRERELVHQLGPRVDGLILVAPVSPDAALRSFAERLPVVTVDRTAPGLPGVVVDTPGGVTKLMDHLLGLGHRRIAYLGGPPGSWMDRQRRKAALTAVADGGGELIVLDPVPPRFDAGLATAEHLVRQETPITAVMVYSSYVLLGLFMGLGSAGLRVPEDISLAASDDLTVIGMTQPGSTALHVPLQEAGSEACRLVRETPAAGSRPPRVRIATRLVVRDSTAAPPSGSTRTPPLTSRAPSHIPSRARKG